MGCWLTMTSHCSLPLEKTSVRVIAQVSRHISANIAHGQVVLKPRGQRAFGDTVFQVGFRHARSR